MGVGKYSPTVSRAYQKNQKWWEENGGNTEKKEHDSWYDNEGYDSYGYNKEDVDRAGNTESDYMCDYDVDYDRYTLAENTYEEWVVNEKGFPAHISQIQKEKEITSDKKLKM